MIEQAIYGAQGSGGYRFLARSPGFEDDWLPEAERLCMAFGERPVGTLCPLAILACPFGPRHVLVMQVADQGKDDTGRPGALGFRLLVLPQALYRHLGGDPFHVSDQLPPPWDARGTLPPLEPDLAPAPPRMVEQLQGVLNVPNSATLLGGVQALLDGGRLVFERKEPDERLLRGLWQLLPSSTRWDLWPASFSFSRQPGFHVLVVPRAESHDYPGYVFEEQAGDYPEGRYELALQSAVERGDQRDLDRLLARRSRSQTLRLAILLLIIFLMAPLVSALLQPPAPPPPRKQDPSPAPAPEGKVPPEAGKKAALPDVPRLPGEEVYLPPELWEREQLARQLAALNERLAVPPPLASSASELTRALEALDAKLGSPRPGRDPSLTALPLQAARSVGWLASPVPQMPLLAATALGAGSTGQLRDWGPLQRQLRVLLWKHGVPDYGVQGPNTLELLERLENKLKLDSQERKP